jgi:hypothetical protein
MQSPSRPLDRVALTANRELRRIDGFWCELPLAPMHDPVYRAVGEHRDVHLNPFHRRSPVVEIEVTVAAWPACRSAIPLPAGTSRSAPKSTKTGRGPTIGGAAQIGAVRSRNDGCAKRELRRHELHDQDPDAGSVREA